MGEELGLTVQEGIKVIELKSIIEISEHYAKYRIREKHSRLCS